VIRRMSVTAMRSLLFSNICEVTDDGKFLER
jgi:hypothetical protein